MKDRENSKCYREKKGQNVQDNLSEWLRRQTRNLLGNARASSNPAVVVFIQTIFLVYSPQIQFFGLHNRCNKERITSKSYFGLECESNKSLNKFL